MDLSEDLLLDPLGDPWVRIGSRLDGSNHVIDERLRTDTFRESILIPKDAFRDLANRLESIGNVLDGLGKPGVCERTDSGRMVRVYDSFHRFAFHFTNVIGEPLVFLSENSNSQTLFINPDVWMYLGLEERAVGQGIWWDPRRGLDVLIRHVIDDDRLEIVDIRKEYLLRYLHASQQSLLIMDRVYFRQEVLEKYEGSSPFDVRDDGSVSCRGYWGLTRSTARLGNDLLCTAIGDFAECVPYEEWPHWKQYSVPPPSRETLLASN